MSLGIIAIVLTTLLAIISSFFAFKDPNNRPTLAGYAFFILSFIACFVAINEHRSSETAKNEADEKLKESERREREALVQLKSSKKRQEHLLAQISFLQEENDKNKITLSEINRPAKNLDIEVKYKYDTSNQMVSLLIDELFEYAALQEQSSEEFSLHEDSLIILDIRWLLSLSLDLYQCDRIPELCLEYHGGRLDILSVLGIETEHHSILQFYQRASFHKEGITELSHDEKFSEYSLAGMSSTIRSQLSVNRNPKRLFYDVTQKYRRIFNRNMGGKADVEDSYVRLAIQNAVPGVEDFYSEITINVYEGEFIIHQRSLDTDTLKNIDAGTYLHGPSFFFTP